MKAFKLFREMADGTIASLFINKKHRFGVGEEYDAQYHPTKGFAERFGFHCTTKCSAPHLSEKGRAWYEVDVKDFTYFKRPESQGGVWLLANKLTVLRKV